jgi:hypothetical protein
VSDHRRRSEQALMPKRAARREHGRRVLRDTGDPTSYEFVWRLRCASGTTTSLLIVRIDLPVTRRFAFGAGCVLGIGQPACWERHLRQEHLPDSLEVCVGLAGAVCHRFTSFDARSRAEARARNSSLSDKRHYFRRAIASRRMPRSAYLLTSTSPLKNPRSFTRSTFFCSAPSSGCMSGSR